MAVPLTLSSVPAQTPYVQYIATAGQTLFPYPFEVTQDSDLVVLLNGAAQPTDSGYTLTGQGTTGGGNVIFNVGLTAGTVVTFYRNISIARITQLSQNGTFFSANFNNEYNRIYLILQQLQQSLPGGNSAFSLMVPNSNNPAPVTVLTPGAYANKILSFDANGNPQPAVLSSSIGALTAAIIGSFITPPTTAEIAAGVAIVNVQYPPNNFLRYGIVPNSLGAAAANTTILQQLWNPTTGLTGVFQLPIVTGADTWYFSANIAMRDGVYLDGNGQTMSWAFATQLADNACGVLTAQRNVKIENVNITWNLTNSTGTSNYGNGLMFGGRGATPSLFPAVYDSLLASPMGNITVRNVKLNGTASATQSRAILMFGGLVNMEFSNITIEGNGALLDAHYYEFGYATNPTDFNSSQSSHAHNLRYTNWNVNGCVNSALSGNGAYDVMVDGLVSTNSNFPVNWGIGEAAFMNPWNPVDLAGAKHLIHLKNCVLSPLIAGGTAITLTGTSGTLAATAAYRPQWVANHTYNNIGDFVFNSGNIYKLLTGAPGSSGNSGGPTGTSLSGITDGSLTWGYVNKQASTDLLDSIIENCTVYGNSGGYGVRLVGMTQVQIKGSYFAGCQRGVDCDQDSTRITIDGCTIRDSTGTGLALAGQAATGVYSSGRSATHAVRNCWIAGNTGSAVSLTFVDSAIIEGNRFGYETGHDDVAETTQTFAVAVDANSFNVIVRGNYVAGVSSGNAYSAQSSGTSRNNRLENNRGVQTAQGSWITDWTQAGSATVISNGNTIAIANTRYIRVAPAGAVTGLILAAGTSIVGEPAQEVVIINESANSITMAASGTSNVANGVSCVIAANTSRRLVWDAVTTLWYQIS